MADITYSAGNSPTAAEMNSYSLHTGGAWNSYTPALVQLGSVTVTVNRGAYWRAGRLIVAQAVVTVTGGSPVANNVIYLSLPVTGASVSTSQPIGTGFIYDSSASAFYACVAMAGSTTNANFITTSTTAAVNAGSTGSAMAAQLATGDIVAYSITYEAASG